MAAPAVETSDLYGFIVKLTELQRAERAACDQSSALVVQPWMECVEKDQLPSSESKVKDMVRKGVPPTCRTWVWLQTSAAAKKKAAVASSYFSMLVSAGTKSPHLAEIEQDAAGTFPQHPWIQSADGKAALVRVLSAYSMHNEKLGYCRAMSNIVGLLLVAMNRNEENAFWLLAALVEDILYPGTYSRNLEGCQVEMRALDELLAHKLPTLHAHLAATDCDISLIATEWYLSLFCTSMPSETVCMVWDGLFNEGPKVLFRVALALLKLNEDLLLGCNNAGDIVMAMRQAAAQLHNRDKLMATAYEGIGSLPMATIDKFRESKAKLVQAEARQRDGTAPAVDAGDVPVGKNEKLEVATEKVKEGFGKFMKGMNKWADKTADKMAKAVEKIGIKDGEEGAAPPK